MSKLIVLEGLDSSGKGTQVEKIKEHFKKKKLSFKYFHFPMYGHNEFSEVIARFLRGEFGDIDEVDPYFVASNYAMDRFRYKPELEAALLENDVVLLDRYVFSNIAYQCAKCNNITDSAALYDWIWKFEFNFLKLPYPNLILFLDVPINIIQERLAKERIGDDRNYLNGKADIHENNLQFQKEVKNQYMLLKNTNRYIIVKCVVDNKLLSPDEVFESYVDYINKVLKYHG